MKEHPIKGDWIIKVQEDWVSLGTSLDKEEENVIQMSKKFFKIYLKENIRKITLKKLEDLKLGQNKVRHINIQTLPNPGNT